MNRNLFSRFTLEEPGSEGGSGGGGDPSPPTPESGVPPLPSKRAREEIYSKADSASEGGTTPQPPTEPTPKEEPAPAKDSPAPTDAAGKAGKEDKTDKRVKDAQAALTVKAQEAADLKRALEEKEARLKLAEKYVDFDKLSEFDKQQAEKAANEPVTRRELEEREKAAAAKEKSKEAEVSPEEEARVREKYLSEYYGKNPHVKPYVESGEAYGVFLKTAERMGPEASLDQIGEEVAEHFRKVDADREAKVAEKLTTRRAAINQGESPRSGGAPRSGDEEATEVDDPQTEVARRMARRAQIFTPRL